MACQWSPAEIPVTSSRPSVVLLSEKLECYDADNELKFIRKWHEMIEETKVVESESMNELEKEAKDQKGKPGSRMEHYLERAMKSKKSVSGLWKAENVVVLMYTDDDDESAFYREYNEASKERKWGPYRIYTALLVSAVKKLAKIDPIPEDKPLFRGLRSKLDPPDAKRIFWKTFTSTSLSHDVAQNVFAGYDGIVFEFKTPDSAHKASEENVSYQIYSGDGIAIDYERMAADKRASRCAAQIKELSYHPEEEEVIILPFEAFDVVIHGQEQFYFKTSEKQDFLASSEDSG